MKQFYFALILLLFFVVGCDSNPGQEKNANAPVDGKAVFTNKCAVCHGDNGKKMLAGASDLSLSELTQEERIQVITFGRKTMAGYRDVFSEKEIAAVAAYVGTLKESAE